MNDLSEYKDLYLQTGREYLQALNDNLVALEKDPHDQAAIDEIFRSAHSLKSQSAAMGYEKTGFLCHTVEDIFYEIKQGRLELRPELADILFKAFDDLTKSVDSIESTDHEADLTAQAEELKKHTGVTTTGAGKSDHSKPTASPPASSPQPSETGTETKPQTVEQKVKTITLQVEQLDTVMDIVEEIMIHRLQMHAFIEQVANPGLSAHYAETTKLLESLQYEIMKARLIPVGVVFDHFPRAIRDLARAENKQVELVINDDNLAIDRSIVERLDEPLIHLLRNAVSHGIDQTGTITISTTKEREWAIIKIHDDGQGIDWDKLRKVSIEAGASPDMSPTDMLFSGISTAEKVTNISGRGVGMKAVKETVEGFGGQIDVQSTPNEGTTFTLKFPLSLAISKVLMVTVGQAQYAIPVGTIERIIRLPTAELKTSADQEVFVLGKTEVPLIRLAQKINHDAPAQADPAKELVIVIVLVNDEPVGLLVDRLIGSLDIVVKTLPESLKSSRLFTGTTILENGQTTLIINPQALV